MKAGIKRIEATLNHLETHSTASAPESDSSTKRSLSFQIAIGTQEKSSDAEESSATESKLQPEENSHPPSVESFPAKESGGKVPNLPKFKTPSFTSHRNAANPALAMNLLQEIQETVASWQNELQKIIRQIQDIYLDGPIVNGWLESHENDSEAGGTATLKHAEVDRLMDYVEEICAPDGTLTHQSLRPKYRLCGLDASGKVWSRPCPPNQVASVSMAIARYQKLRQLLGRKQYLENRLTQLAETLVILQSHLQTP